MTEAFPGTGSQEQDQHGWSQEIPKIYNIFYRVRKCLEKYNTFFTEFGNSQKKKHIFYRVRKFKNIIQNLQSTEIPKFNRFLICQEIPKFNTVLTES
jgi:hypothetical protein